MAFAVILASSAGARAAGSEGIAIHTLDCPRLDGREIARLVRIELGATLAREQELVTELSCDGPRLRIVAIDPLTDKRLEREVDLAGLSAPSDRVVAILVSQLFLTSWSELLLVPPPGEEKVPLPPPRIQLAPETRRAVEQRTRAGLQASPWRWDVAFLGGARVRDLGAPLLDGRLAVRPALAAGNVRFFVELGYERGSASRASGSVAVSLAQAALGVGFRPVAASAFTLDLHAAAGILWADLAGATATPGVETSSVSGAAWEGALGVTPGLRLGTFHAGLLLEGGVTFPRALAHVAGDRDVSLAGPWLGASLVLGLAAQEGR